MRYQFRPAQSPSAPLARNIVPRQTWRYFICWTAESVILFSVTEHHNCRPSHGLGILHEALRERTAPEERLSRRLGLDRSAPFRLRYSGIPPGDGAVPAEAFVWLPGKFRSMHKVKLQWISCICPAAGSYVLICDVGIVHCLNAFFGSYNNLYFTWSTNGVLQIFLRVPHCTRFWTAF